jgi:hypothetical protein
MGHPEFPDPVSDRVTSYYFRATSIARLCLVRLTARCYCADRDIEVPPLRITEVDPEFGGAFMKKVHLFYAALGFAVARWIFKRQAVVDPVTRFRSQGLL